MGNIELEGVNAEHQILGRNREVGSDNAIGLCVRACVIGVAAYRSLVYEQVAVQERCGGIVRKERDVSASGYIRSAEGKVLEKRNHGAVGRGAEGGAGRVTGIRKRDPPGAGEWICPNGMFLNNHVIADRVALGIVDKRGVTRKRNDSGIT